MELQLDRNKTYAIALEGGGAKGAYEVGVWRALNEAGIRFNAVSGASVGALNGAMMAMGDLERAEQLWRNISFSQVMNVDDRVMRGLFSKDLRGVELGTVMRQARDVVRDKGFDVEPLRRLLAEAVDEEKVRTSPVDFFLVTYSLSEMKKLDIAAKKLPPGQLHDMLLASAYFPAFKNEKLRGKRYTDGGVNDAVPIDSLLDRGYRNIIVVRLYGFGLIRRVRIPSDATITTIAPTVQLGQILNFSREQSERLLRLGYFDAQRVLYGLSGTRYYLERTLDEQQAYEQLVQWARLYCRTQGVLPSLRQLHEEYLPQLARDAGVKEGDYYQLLIAYAEKAAQEFGLAQYEIMTDAELLRRVLAARAVRPSPLLPAKFRWIPRPRPAAPAPRPKESL